ncbi:MAG: hypothetical protein ACC707_02475 [Thiohalomonadales bacterium]
MSMIGKKNVVFGFLFLVISASLGPLMIIEYTPGVTLAQDKKQVDVGRLQTLQADDFEEDLDPLPADAIAKANTAGILALNNLVNANQPIDMAKIPHTHGNLESLLNIAVGIALGFIAVPLLFKQAISWIFIVGTLLHSGVMFLAVIVEQAWALAILNSGVGPALILLGLLLMGIAAAMGFKGEIVQD